MKYPDHIIRKAMNHKIEKKRGEYFIDPTTEGEAYRHKVTVNHLTTDCGCKWTQVHKNQPEARLCSHRLAVLFQIDREAFIEEIKKRQW